MINGVSSATSATYAATQAVTAKPSKEASTVKDTGVVYEKTNAAYQKDNAALIAQLKADSANRVNQMKSLVTQMFEKQGIKLGTADDMWKILASGEFTADPATIAQAKEDISEDGYWGVKQTSERIFEFAMALSGGDEETMEKMREAVEKGFGEATKSWGRDLPEISSNTYDAVMAKFDSFFAGDEETAE